MFLIGALYNRRIIKVYLGYLTLWVLWEKKISCVCLDKSELTAIFHWNTHSEILFKSSFNCFADKATSWTTEKKDVSLAKSFDWWQVFAEIINIYQKEKRP